MDEARSRDQPFVSLPEGDDEVDMLPRESMVDPKTTSLTNLWCVWSVSFLTAIDGTVAVPSLWCAEPRANRGSNMRHSEYIER